MYIGGNEVAEGDDLSVDLRPSRQGRKRKVMVPGRRVNERLIVIRIDIY